MAEHQAMTRSQDGASGKGQKYQNKSKTGPLPADTCHQQQPEEVIEKFGGHHDIITVDHSLCEGVEYISTVAKGQDKQLTQTSVEKVKKDRPYIASLLGEYSITVQPDEQVPAIRGVCVLDNNQTIITDCTNDRLKRLDSTFKVTDWVDISGCPWGICKTGPTELAVTLRNAKKVQFISVGGSLSLTRSFSVGERCRSICHSQGELYVCHGVFGELEIGVYDMSGSRLRVIMKQQQDIISPRSITVSRNNSLLYIADEDTGVIVIDKQSNEETVFTDPRLQGAHDVTVDDRDQLFVCNCISHNVIQIDSQGNVIQELLTQTDGITDPATVTYLPNPPRIMVTQEYCDEIKIFRLS